MENKKNKKKQGLLAVLGLLSVLLITVGVTYAFFSYTRTGTTENSITSGNISFLYTENTKIGKGIMLQDAIPMTDAQGKLQSGEGKVFEFSITSKTGTSIAVPYEVTARMSSDSNLDPSVVKLYLEKGNEEVLLEKYSELPQTTHQTSNNVVEKVIYNGKVPRGSSNYSESFKLRMWIDEETEYSQVDVTKYYCDGTLVSEADYNTCLGEKTTQTVKEYPYNDKLFKITVNVYANGKMLTEEDLNLEKSTSLTTLSVNNGASLYQDGETSFTTSTSDSSITLNVVPKNLLAKVTITKTDSTYTNPVAMNNTGVIPISAVNRTYTLTTGEHYFKIVITPEDTSVSSQEYHLQVTKLPSTVNTLSSLSIADCPLNESFDSTIDTYTCTTDQASLTVNATTTDSGATTAISGNTNLIVGTNTITVVVTPEDTTATSKTYTITVTREKSYVEVSGDSILKILADNDLAEGYYRFKINGKTESYPVHLYVYNGDTTISTNTKFGAEDDVSTDVNGTRQYAEAMVAVKVKGNLTNTAKIEPYYNTTTNYGGPKGLLLYVTGTLNNTGTIDNSHGAYAEGQDVYLWKNSNETYEYVPAVGASGGTGIINQNGNPGKSGTDSSIALTTASRRATGGGGAGGAAQYDAKSGNGGSGTSYSGGSGSGRALWGAQGSDASNEGGTGGIGISDSGPGKAEGGTGNPGGAQAGANGTGGLLVIYANNLNNTGNLVAKGTDTQYASGASGGGSINVFYNTITSLGTTNANGGVSSYNSPNGTGGNGTVSIGSISTGSYVAN